MKAILKLRPEPGAMALRQVEPPARAAGEALIRITGAGICGTDVSIWKWYEAVVGQYAPTFPLIVGHEFAGVVEDPGEDVRLKAGDTVAVNPQIACGRCYYCGLGRPTLCENRKLMGGRVNGGWTELVAVPAYNVHPLPAGIDPRVAPLLEPLSVATHAVIERVPVRPGDVVAVVGAGPIGILCAVLALAAGASEVVVTGVSADKGRLALARTLGATPVNVDDADPVSVVTKIQRDGADVVYETSGNAAVLGQTIAMARRSGRIGLIGLCQGTSELRSTPVVLRELEIIGSRGYNETTWALMMKALPPVTAAVLQLVTHEMPYEDFEHALRLVETRQCSKIVLRP